MCPRDEMVTRFLTACSEIIPTSIPFLQIPIFQFRRGCWISWKALGGEEETLRLISFIPL